MTASPPSDSASTSRDAMGRLTADMLTDAEKYGATPREAAPGVADRSTGGIGACFGRPGEPAAAHTEGAGHGDPR
ncbi:hypothetical protein ABZY02_30975 [Streptomyces sp. NPDC006649]|uniref:hypothetical protein n=1 Tax=unclassified Streptomyces TaxID=2593676 RepID=UPI0032540F7C